MNEVPLYTFNPEPQTGPAKSSKQLHVGDQILAIDGVDVAGWQVIPRRLEKSRALCAVESTVWMGLWVKWRERERDNRLRALCPTRPHTVGPDPGHRRR